MRVRECTERRLRADNKFHEEGVYPGEEARMSRGETLPISGYRNIERSVACKLSTPLVALSRRCPVRGRLSPSRNAKGRGLKDIADLVRFEFNIN